MSTGASISLQLRRILLCLSLYFVYSTSHALEVSGEGTEYNLSPEIQYLTTPTGNFKPDFSDTKNQNHLFKPNSAENQELNLGFVDGSVWIRIFLSRAKGSNSHWILEIPYLGLDKVDLYQADGSILKNGSIYAVDKRPYFSRYYAFPVTLGETPQPYYLKISSSYPITIPLKLIERNSFSQNQFTENLLQAMYYGGLLSLLFYNFVLFLVIKDKKFLIYTLFAASTGLGIFAGNGYARMYLWPNAAAWDQVSQSVLLSIGGSLALIFTMVFLRTKQSAPIAHRMMSIFAMIYFLLAALLISSIYLPIPTAPIYFGIFSLSIISPAVAFYSSAKNVINGAQSASYFIMGWGAFCIGVITASLRLLNLAPNNIFTLYALQISSAVEMLLFSFALAHRFQSEQNEKGIIQEQLLKSKEETVSALRLSEERLELAVNARTEKLQQLLLSEQHMREQYVRFGAMIAHEFRNPLNIIQAQTTMLEHDSKSSPDKVLNRASLIQTAVSRLVQLFDQWLESDRLSNAGSKIDTQTILVNPWLNALIASHKNYYSDHELIYINTAESLSIWGDEHLIQLAVLNLIDNACKYSEKNTKIYIGISQDEYGVGIFVKDEGCGIPLDMQERILEPYVRIDNAVKTKGSGLGLAFVKRIMEAHDGRVQIQSNPQHGTTITLWFAELVT